MNPYSVIVRPVLSEKSDATRERESKYTFEIKRDASKNDVKAAVEALFDVKVASVNTCITRGKMRRKGMHVSMSSNKKKAVVTLHQGQKLDIFEG